MIRELFFLFFLVGLVVSESMVSLDPVTVNKKPINNARFSKKATDLYGTNIVGLYKLGSAGSPPKHNVLVKDINDTNPEDLLYCERTPENSYMSLHIKTSTGQNLVCKEKYAELPITLYCQEYFSRHRSCNNLYIKRHTVPLDATKSMATVTTIMHEKYVLTDDPKTESANFNLLKLPPEFWYFMTAAFLIVCIVVVLCCCIIVMIVAAISIRKAMFTKASSPNVSDSVQSVRYHMPPQTYENRGMASSYLPEQASPDTTRAPLVAGDNQ